MPTGSDESVDRASPLQSDTASWPRCQTAKTEPRRQPCPSPRSGHSTSRSPPRWGGCVRATPGPAFECPTPPACSALAVSSRLLAPSTASHSAARSWRLATARTSSPSPLRSARPSANRRRRCRRPYRATPQLTPRADASIDVKRRALDAGGRVGSGSDTRTSRVIQLGQTRRRDCQGCGGKQWNRRMTSITSTFR